MKQKILMACDITQSDPDYNTPGHGIIDDEHKILKEYTHILGVLLLLLMKQE